MRLRLALEAARSTDVIVREETDVGSTYHIYASTKDLAGAIRENPRVAYHEVIRAPLPKRMFFDLDIQIDHHDPRARELEAINALGRAIKKRWPGAALRVSSSSDYVTKISVHVVVLGVHYADLPTMAADVAEIKADLPKWLGRAVDSVYKTHQNLRALGSPKHGTQRIKRAIGQDSDLKNHLVHDYAGSDPTPTNVPTRALASAARLPPNSAPTDPDAVLEALERAERAAADDIGGGHPRPGGAYSIRSWSHEATLMSFTRTQPSACPLCKRIHNSENPYATLSSGVWWLRCPRSADTRLKYPLYAPPRHAPGPFPDSPETVDLGVHPCPCDAL